MRSSSNIDSDMGKWREDGELVRGSGESDPRAGGEERRGDRKGKKSVPHLQLEFERKKGEMLFLR
jgi:hypothetical protein